MFLEFYKNNWKGILNFLLFIFSAFVFIFAFKQFYVVAGSIVFGLIFFAFIEPLAGFLNRKGMKKALASIISGLLVVLVFIGTSVLFSSMILNFLSDFSKTLPKYSENVQTYITDSTNFVVEKIDAIPVSFIEKIKESFSTIVGKTSAIVSVALGGFVVSLSSSFSFFTNVLLGYIFAIMLSIDLKDWKSFSNRYAPSGIIKAFNFLKENVIKGISSYIIAQSKLISITFVVILIALLILGVENAFTIAFIGGILDVLPLLGVSTLFVPWIIYLFIKGNLVLAISLTVVLIIVLGTRQILEPKITGDSLGVNASVMLLGFILSTSILGFWGIFLSPVLIILVKELIVQGYLETWFGWKAKEVEEDVLSEDEEVVVNNEGNN